MINSDDIFEVTSAIITDLRHDLIYDPSLTSLAQTVEETIPIIERLEDEIGSRDELIEKLRGRVLQSEVSRMWWLSVEEELNGAGKFWEQLTDKQKEYWINRMREN